MKLIKKNRLSRSEFSCVKRATAELSKTINFTRTVPTGEASSLLQPEEVVRHEETKAGHHSVLKQKVLFLISKYRKDINEEGLPKIKSVLKSCFEIQPHQAYYHLMDRREKRKTNVSSSSEIRWNCSGPNRERR